MKSSLPKIVFIGSGNVATSLSEALKGKRDIIQVYSKTLTHARKLAKKPGCTFTNDLKKITTDADLYIIAVKDDAIVEICKKLKLKGKTVIHTSGSTELNVLKKVSDKYGVLWPMYSFNVGNGLKSFPMDTPVFIEASDKKTEKNLTDLVKNLKGRPYYINSEKRAIMHLTAVFVNNFPNHLFAIAEDLCKTAGIPFSLFLPLAKETVNTIAKKSPSHTQTGPASRNDKQILNKHIALLSEGTPIGKVHPLYKKVYKVLTESIIHINNVGRKKL